MANTLKSIWPAAKRGFQCRGGGKEASDVEGTPYHIECKHKKRVNVLDAYKQALSDTDGRPVIIVSQENRSPTLVTMEISEWLKLVGTAHEKPNS